MDGEAFHQVGRGYPDRGTPNDTKIGLVRAVRD
jgi:hypothetical protein